ncbi:hypothetical protein [Streptomyces hydrogenans]|uniref:hypothetical protein n=1 Tax=Streptomyces hydrogenans TaxID=1873719 RepID=UPI003829EA57
MHAGTDSRAPATAGARPHPNDQAEQIPASRNLFAQAAASEHASTLALHNGDLELAKTHATLGRLRLGLALRQAAEECLFCNGYGAVPEHCPTDCTEHDPHDRTPRHWTGCPNRTAHPPVLDPASTRT